MTKDDVARFTRELYRTRLVRGCMTCVFFEEHTETCREYQQRPPARVIAFGCPTWEDMAQGQFQPLEADPLRGLS